MSSLLVYITAPDPESARRLTRTLVIERLAACAKIIDGANSLYWWQDRLEETQESLCLFKTSAERYEALEWRARQLHPYETPCIIALPIDRGYAPFLEWISTETDPKDTSIATEEDVLLLMKGKNPPPAKA